MSEHKVKEAAVEEALKDRIPVLVGTKDGSCFYGEAEVDKPRFITDVEGPWTLCLYNCQMIMGLSQTTKGWFDLAGRGPDASCVVSPPVECALISEVTKVLSCTDAAARRWKAQGSVLAVMPGGGRIVPARNQ